MHAWEVIRCAAQHKVHGRIAAANNGEADRQALPAGMRLDLSATSRWTLASGTARWQRHHRVCSADGSLLVNAEM